MHKVVNHIQGTGKVLACSAALLITCAATQPSLAAKKSPGDNSVAEIDVFFSEDCLSASVVSSKDLSNIVVAMVDGTSEKFEGFGDGAKEFNIEQSDADEPTPMMTVYVKSGSGKVGKVDGLSGHLGIPFGCELDEVEQEELFEEEEFEEEEFIDDDV